MANVRKQGFFSSLFRTRKLTEEEATAEQESKLRLEERIQQALAERAVVPALLIAEEKGSEAKPLEEEVEPPVELLPISASALSPRKAVVPNVFFLTNVEEVGSYATNKQ